MRTNYAPVVADLFLFCNERDIMMSLSNNTHEMVWNYEEIDIDRSRLIFI